MSINKFGIQLVKGDAKRGEARWNDTGFRNYVRENSLCVDTTGEVFDAKSRKIRRLASPETDGDAVNKLHLDRRFKIWKTDNDLFLQSYFISLQNQIDEIRILIRAVESNLDKKIAEIESFLRISKN